MADLFKNYRKKNNQKNTEEYKVELTQEEVKKELIEEQRTRNRRRMAYICLSTILAILLYTAFNPDLTDNQVTVFNSFGLFLCSIVVAYYTGNTIKEVSFKKTGSND